MPAFLRALCLLFLFAVSGLVLAQNKPAESLPARLSSVASKLEDVSKSVREDDNDDAALLQLRTQLEPLTTDTQAIIDEVQPQVDAARQRLEQAGPKPEANAPPEAPETAKARADLQKEVDEADALLRRARVLSVRITQVAGEITNARRDLLLGEIFKRSSSVLDPTLWYNAATSMPRVWRTGSFVVSDWSNRISSRLYGARLFRFLGAVAALILAFVILRRISRSHVLRKPPGWTPSPLEKILAAIWTAFVIAVLPLAAAMVFVEILKFFDVLTRFVAPLADGFIDAVKIISVGAGVGRALFAPGHPERRLIELPDQVARRFNSLTVNFVIIVAVLRLVEVISGIVAAPLDVSIALRALLTSIAVGVMSYSIFGAARISRLLDAELGPSLSAKRDWFALWRVLIWAAILCVFGANLLGYVNFANFIVNQIMWVTFLLMAGFVLFSLAHEAIARTMQPDSAFARAAATALGMQPSALKQMAILLSGFVTLLIYFVGILLVLAPWGVESNSVFDTLQAAFYGFTFGAISFSLSGVVIAIVLFTLGFLATRAFQRWLEGNYLPATQLDSGLQNSITTSAGYVGVVAAIALPFAYLGFNFEKLAIVAGALSLGIGFGLQSIVSNFVSGLILLWERAIKVGDWVIVGADQGIVKRINVRSTEIETFERQTVIVPNSNLISGIVKNWVRMDRSGRLNIDVKVDYSTDPDKVRDLLIACAQAHRHVLDAPKPYVNFVEFGDKSLHFNLRCFVDDVDHMGGARSDLNFEIFRRLKEAQIIITQA